MSEDEEEPLGDLRNEIDGRADAAETDRSEPAAEEETPTGRDADTGEPGDDADESDGPLGDLRRKVESRSDASGKAFTDSETDAATGEEHFAEMDVGDVDTDEVWADLLVDDDAPMEGSVPAAEFEVDSGKPGTVVTKRLCHRCQYFGDPPTLYCTHDGTSIEGLVDMNHYRVLDCPMVETEEES